MEDKGGRGAEECGGDRKREQVNMIVQYHFTSAARPQVGCCIQSITLQPCHLPSQVTLAHLKGPFKGPVIIGYPLLKPVIPTNWVNEVIVSQEACSSNLCAYHCNTPLPPGEVGISSSDEIPRGRTLYSLYLSLSIQDSFIPVHSMVLCGTVPSASQPRVFFCTHYDYTAKNVWLQRYHKVRR